MPRMERARRPPKAENRAHIPRAIASREAMLWQGCSLSPRELERKAPRSVWATQLPASRPIRWIVRESREANRTDFARIPSDGLRDAPRASIGRTHIRNPLARFPTDGQPPASRQPHRQFNHYTTASQLRANCRKLQPIHNRSSTATPTIFQSPSNHHPHAPRPSLLPSAATRTEIFFLNRCTDHTPNTRTLFIRFAHTTPPLLIQSLPPFVRVHTRDLHLWQSQLGS